jgi:anti-anti-sigma factor
MELEHRQKNGYLVLKLKGDFDLNDTEYFEKTVKELKGTSNKIIADLTDLEYMDSAGIGQLIQLQTDLANEPSGELYLTGINDFIYGVLDVANLISFFTMINEEQKQQLLS